MKAQQIVAEGLRRKLQERDLALHGDTGLAILDLRQGQPGLGEQGFGRNSRRPQPRREKAGNTASRARQRIEADLARCGHYLLRENTCACDPFAARQVLWRRTSSDWHEITRFADG